MKILYGVNGEGMGHATRSEVVIESLIGEHDVRIMASGAAYRYLSGFFGNVSKVFGPSFALENGEIRKWQSVTGVLTMARKEIPESVNTWFEMVREWQPDVVVTDFEPLSGVYARWSQTPLVCVDNIHMIDRCRHDPEILKGAFEEVRVARAVVRAMSTPAGDYVIPTLFHPEVIKGRTRLVRPILRQPVIDATPTAGEHLVVYSAGDEGLTEVLRDCEIPCHVYGMRDSDAVGTTDGAIEHRPRSTDGFLEDLASCRGVITGGGFSLLGEAVYLGKPILSVPIKGQFEQLMNSRYIEREGYGHSARVVDREALESFIGSLDVPREKLIDYPREGNGDAVRTIVETVEAAGADSRRDRRRARREARRKPREATL